MTDHNAHQCYIRYTEYAINRAQKYPEFIEGDKITVDEYKYYDGPLRDALKINETKSKEIKSKETKLKETKLKETKLKETKLKETKLKETNNKCQILSNNS